MINLRLGLLVFSGNNPDPSKRPDAIGNSYGCPTSELCSATSLLTAMNNLRAAGIFMAVSAGNSGSACSTVTDPPALYDSAITVGATGFQSNKIANYSSRGPVTADGSGRAKPDLVAPGSSVRSSYPTNSYATLSGTAMASPHVAARWRCYGRPFPHCAAMSITPSLFWNRTGRVGYICGRVRKACAGLFGEGMSR